jgi:hypothetical protein
VVLEYVSIIDRSTQAISDVQAVLHGHLSRLDAAASGAGSPTSSPRALDPSSASPPGSLRASLGGLTSQMEKLTDIAGSKLGTIGNRLRNMGGASTQNESFGAPNVGGASASTASSKASKLAAMCRDDTERLESRRAQLLLKKTWLRQHVMERGDL